jgi:hypothetical protein
MKQHADAEVLVPDAPEQVELPVDEVFGSYASAEGRRTVRAVTTGEHGLCLIDEGTDGALLIEPRLEGMVEAGAVVADYLSLASERGEPQTRHPWPPTSGSIRGGS